MSEQEFLRSIKKLKRSPKLGKIYEIYRMEQEQTLCTTTLERQNKVWLKHLSQLEDFRVDRLEPLYIQKKIINPIYKEGKYTTCLYTARLLITILDFSIACNLIQRNLFKRALYLASIKKSISATK